MRAYVRRNKTDAADAAALLEAARANDIKPVGVKSIEQQALQALHRTREAWKSTRTRRINTLRGFCREFGLVVPEGAATGIAQMARYLADEQSGLPAMLRSPMRLMLDEIRLIEARMSFDSGRRYASFLGLTPREYSSGNTRYLSRISKKGDRYIRTLLTHGARSVLRSATVARRAGREIDRLKCWALEMQGRTNHNKAACALANKLARIAWAVWVKQETYRGQALPAVQSPLCSA